MLLKPVRCHFVVEFTLLSVLHFALFPRTMTKMYRFDCIWVCLIDSSFYWL